MDDMEEVTQRFLADVEDYVAEMREAAGEARSFADANLEAKAGADEMRDGALEAAEALGRERDEAIEASAALHDVRDAEVEAGAAGASEGAGGMGMMAFAIAGLIGLLAAVAPAAVAAVGAFGAFAVFAYPAVKQVTGALGDTKAQLAKLPEPVRIVVEEFKNVEAQWKQLSAQFALPVENMLGQALGDISDLLPKLIPLAETGMAAVQGIMDAIGRGLDSKGFADFMSMLEQLSGPATSALIGLAGAIGGVLLDALEQLAPYAVPMIKMLQGLVAAAGPALVGALVFLAQAIMDIGKAITPVLGPLGKFFAYLDDHPVFAQIAAGILGVVAAIKIFQGVMSLVSMLSNPWVLLAVAIAVVAILIATHTHQIAVAFDDVRHHVAEAGHEIAHTFDDIRHDVAQWAGDVRHDIAHVGDDIIRPFQLAAAWISGHWKEIAAWLVDPVGMAVHEIKTHTHQIAQAFDTMRHDAAATLGRWRHDIANAVDDAMVDVDRFTTWLPHQVAQKFDEARHDAATAADGARHDTAVAWDGMRHDVATLVDDVLRFFSRLPGQILSFLASLPGRMLSVGRNVIMGLINGIESAASAIPGIMSGLASDVASYFTDPLKLFSPSRLFFEHGWNIVQGAINGVKANAPGLLAAMRGLGGQVGAGGLPGAAGGGGGYGGSGQVHVTVPLTAVFGAGTGSLATDPRFMQFIQAAVQEAVARWGLSNPGTGFGLPGRA